jgi:molybdate-binding protein/predicted nucleic acid-binding protein
MNSEPVRLLLDTSYCLYLIRERPAAARTGFAAFAPGEIAVSSITVAALQGYAQASSQPEPNRRALEHFLLPLVVADFDAEAARLLAGASAQGQLQRNVHAALLAAHAIRLDATLVTRRFDLYAGTPGLRLQAEVGSEVEVTAAAFLPIVALPPPEGTGPGGDRETKALRLGKPAARLAPRLSAPASGSHTIVLTGSHDLCLDLLAERLHAQHPAYVLAAAHVGSMAGLIALLDHEAHLAGAHLLDGETGEYNTSFIRRMLVPNGIHVVVLGFVGRIQGLIVAHDNPKEIHALRDLRRPDVRFINRQSGAGTRVLLDYHLQQKGISPAEVQGYDLEAPTHSAIASAVAQGQVDCGLGIQAAAQAFGLHFLPLFEERFDLIIPIEYYSAVILEPLLALVRQPDSSFRQRVAQLGGYDASQMGKVLAVY